MQYRQYGKDGPMISRLGFGVMRLPVRKYRGKMEVNFSKAVPLLRHAMEGGVNFLDSHHMYHEGQSEEVIGRALKGWKGQRIYIQTKAPMYSNRPLKYYKQLLEEALEKCGVDCIDYLLTHSLRMDAYNKCGRKFIKLTDWALKKGYIRHRGFSSHDTPENIRRFIDSGDYAVMLVSCNWRDRQQVDTIAYAASRGMGVAVMNPVGGGMLAENARQILRLLPGAGSAAEVALRYVLSIPRLTLTLSGMSTLEQVEENLRIAGHKKPLTAKQKRALLARVKTLEDKARHICTACGYCMPCPHGVNIPANFTYLNLALFFGLVETARQRFRRLARNPADDASALACTHCGKCLPKCPNNVPIIDLLAETAELLGE